MGRSSMKTSINFNFKPTVQAQCTFQRTESLGHLSAKVGKKKLHPNIKMRLRSLHGWYTVQYHKQNGSIIAMKGTVDCDHIHFFKKALNVIKWYK